MTRSRFGDIYFNLQRQRQLEEQYRENAGRQAEANATYLSSGAGQVMAPEPIMFPSPFVQKPSVQYGHIVDKLPDPTYWQPPRCTGGVARWVTDPAEQENPPKPGGVFYLGFYPFVTVYVPPQPLVGELTSSQVNEYRVLLAGNPPVVDVTHQFSFRGEAYKKLPQHVEQSLTE